MKLFSKASALLALHASVAAAANSVANTILVFARDSASANVATLGLQGYGIPYQTVLVPQTGAALPVLNSSATQGNYGGILVLSEVSYQYSTGFLSALNASQWQALYDYQTAFGVRMVRLDVYPTPDMGKSATQIVTLQASHASSSLTLYLPTQVSPHTLPVLAAVMPVSNSSSASMTAQHSPGLISRPGQPPALQVSGTTLRKSPTAASPPPLPSLLLGALSLPTQPQPLSTRLVAVSRWSSSSAGLPTGL